MNPFRAGCFARSFLLVGLLGVVPRLGFAATAVISLRCEGELDPLGVDAPRPRLAWRLQSERDGAAQAAFRIVVASSEDGVLRHVGDLWDSGRTASAENGAEYGGRAPVSGQEVYWSVEVWDEQGSASWSAPGRWTAGIMQAQDWGSARWITDPELLRLRRPLIGYRSHDSAAADVKRSILIDLAGLHAVDSVFLRGLRYGVVDGAGFPIRFRVELSTTTDFHDSRLLADYLRSDFPNRWTSELGLPAGRTMARYVRLTATRLRGEEGKYFLGFSHLEVRGEGRDLATGAAVTASDSVETGPWSARALVDVLGGPEGNPRANATLRLRRRFSVRGGLRRAVLHVGGEGAYTLEVNDRPVGDDLFAPGWTRTDRTCLYQTRDLTAVLRAGGNVLELTLAGGMYNVQPSRLSRFVTPMNPLTAIARLQLTYADGSTEVIASDREWELVQTPTTFANVYGGEDYDARLRAPVARGQAVAWEGPGGTLRGHSSAGPPVRRFERFAGRPVGAPRPGLSVFDLGQNAAMSFRFVAHGPAGSSLRITPSELLDPEGLADSRSSGGVAWCTWTLAGAGREQWEPQFFYRGCRYLQVESLPGPTGGAGPVLDEIEARAVHADALPAGEFSCSDALFNRVHALIGWAQRSNMVSVFTDCPHRERLGWLEQLHLNGPSLRYNQQADALFAKSVRDMIDAQQPDGLVPDTAPDFSRLTDGYRDSPEWGSACVLVPWQQFEFTGDVGLLRESYPMMTGYLAYLGTTMNEGILDYGLGDWYDLGPNPPGPAQLTPVALTATAFFAADAAVVARTAALLNHAADAAKYEALAATLRARFNRRFLAASGESYSTDSQCADALPLALGLVPDERRAAVTAALTAAVRRDGNAITAGDVGYRFVLRALGDAGRSDVIAALNAQTDRPGYGYQLRRGATSLTEAWDAGPSSSQDHFMLGQIEEWFYHNLAGLQIDPDHPGFRHFIVRPAFVPGLTWVRAAYCSQQGWIRIHWERTGSVVRIELEVPPNASATVILGDRKIEAAAGRHSWDL